MRLISKGLESGSGERSNRPQKEFQNIRRHGLWSEALFENIFYTSFRTNCFILLRKITSLSLPLRTYTESRITGLRSRKHNQPLQRTVNRR